MQKLTKSKYDEYEKHFVTGDMTLKEIAVDFGLSYEGLRQHSSKNNWAKKKQKLEKQVNKRLTKITQKRIEDEAETLDDKNRRRAKNWRKFEHIVMNMMESPEIKPNEILSLTRAYSNICKGERLEDAQPTEVVKQEKPDSDRNPVFEYILQAENYKVLLEETEKRLYKFAKLENGKYPEKTVTEELTVDE